MLESAVLRDEALLRSFGFADAYTREVERLHRYADDVERIQRQADDISRWHDHADAYQRLEDQMGEIRKMERAVAASALFSIEEAILEPQRNVRESMEQAAAAVQQAMEVHQASGLFRRLSAQIKEFEQSLDDEHEVGVSLVNYGGMVIRLTSVSCKNPDLIVFEGINDQGNHVRLVQHKDQVSVMFVRLPKEGPVARRIGLV